MRFTGRLWSRSSSSGVLPDPKLESFVEQLRAAGYQSASIVSRRRIVQTFLHWVAGQGLAASQCDESQVVGFLRRSRSRFRHRAKIERATIRLFLRQVRGEVGVRHTLLRIGAPPCDPLEQRYVKHLRDERGLAQNSISVYTPPVRMFLRALGSRRPIAPSALNARQVQRFMLDRIQGRSSEWARLLSVALRSFLRFLYAQGETPVDLSLCVPKVRKWRQASVPNHLAPDEVDRVLSTPSRSTTVGLRDRAILLLLSRLGLRAGEVILMELDDIRWRSGEIAIRGKGGRQDRLPLLPDVGRALAAYLRKGRRRGTSRRVFLRSIPPHVGLTGPAAVGHIVRKVLVQAGIPRTSRGAAHIFRHSLATTMIRRGASLTEISEVLRHRSQETTTIYAKVDFDALRSVARPWPRTGGAR